MENVGTFYNHLEYILQSFGRFTLWIFGNLMAIWYILPSFGILYQQKSGNLDKNAAFP
jgi:uncharacterized membrane protein